MQRLRSQVDAAENQLASCQLALRSVDGELQRTQMLLADRDSKITVRLVRRVYHYFLNCLDTCGGHD